eukprot:6175256-Pleurochrysis_carterae.AAC.4
MPHNTTSRLNFELDLELGPMLPARYQRHTSRLLRDDEFWRGPKCVTLRRRGAAAQQARVPPQRPPDPTSSSFDDAGTVFHYPYNAKHIIECRINLLLIPGGTGWRKRQSLAQAGTGWRKY